MGAQFSLTPPWFSPPRLRHGFSVPVWQYNLTYWTYWTSFITLWLGFVVFWYWLRKPPISTKLPTWLPWDCKHFSMVIYVFGLRNHFYFLFLFSVSVCWLLSSSLPLSLLELRTELMALCLQDSITELNPQSQLILFHFSKKTYYPFYYLLLYLLLVFFWFMVLTFWNWIL